MIPLHIYRIIAEEGSITDVIKLSMINKTLYYGLKDIRFKKYESYIHRDFDNVFIYEFIEYLREYPEYKDRSFFPEIKLHLLSDKVLNFIKEYYDVYDIISPESIDDLCHYGKLDELKCLYYKFGYTFHEDEYGGFMMTTAAYYGHLDIMIWLRDIGVLVTDNAFSCAAIKGYLYIMKWLYNNYKHSYCSSAIEYAAKFNHFDVVKWLCENCETNEYSYEKNYKDIIKVAMKYGHKDIAIYIINWIEDCKKYDYDFEKYDTDELRSSV